MSLEAILTGLTTLLLGSLVTGFIVFARRTVTHKDMERAFDLNTKIILERVRSDPNAKLWEDRVERALAAGEKNSDGIMKILLAVGRIEDSLVIVKEEMLKHERKIQHLDDRINGLKHDFDGIQQKKS